MLLKKWSDHGHSITCVWDGEAPMEKKIIIKERRSLRDFAANDKKELEEYIEKFRDQLSESDIRHATAAITALSWRCWHMTGKKRMEIQETLGPSIRHIHARGEADDMLVDMSASNMVDVVLTLDSDLFALGTEHIWRLLQIRGEWIVEDIHVEDACNRHGITLSMLQEACFLGGWDRCHLNGKPYMALGTALNRIKFYFTLAAVVERFHEEVPIDEEAIHRLNVIKKDSKKRWNAILKARYLDEPFADHIGLQHTEMRQLQVGL
jgi:hypothetical protein